MRTFALVYQCGIANVFDCTNAKLQSDSRRVYQGDYRSAECIARGAKLAGAIVTVCHADVAGDCLNAPWKGGPGSLWAESKQEIR